MKYEASNSVIFSCLFNESKEYLDVLVENFYYYNPKESYMIVNISKQSALDIEDSALVGDRFFIIRSKKERYKMGSGLLAAHIENFIFLDDIGIHSDYFCTMASNSLFIQSCNMASINSSLSHANDVEYFDIDLLPSGWWWDNIKKNNGFNSIISDMKIKQLSQSQIEGLISSRNNWILIRKFYDIIADRNLDKEYLFPYEEILPSTIIDTLGDRKRSSICKVFWDRTEGSGEGIVSFSDIIKNTSTSNLLLKWFKRDANALCTYAVSNVFWRNIVNLYNNHILKEHSKATMQDYMLARSFERFLKKENGYNLIESKKFISEASMDRNIIVASKANRNIIDFRYNESYSDSYIYMEDTEHNLLFNIGIHISYGSNSSFVVSSKCDNAALKNIIVGYYYVKYRHISNMKYIECEIKSNEYVISPLAWRLNLLDNQIYKLIPVQSVETYSNSAFIIFSTQDTIDENNENNYIGLPILANAKYEYEFSGIGKM